MMHFKDGVGYYICTVGLEPTRIIFVEDGETLCGHCKWLKEEARIKRERHLRSMDALKK